MTQDMPDNTDPAPQRPRLGGGGPLALLILIGTVIGGLFHQASVGFLIGLLLGILVAILIWRAGPR